MNGFYKIDFDWKRVEFKLINVWIYSCKDEANKKFKAKNQLYKQKLQNQRFKLQSIHIQTYQN